MASISKASKSTKDEIDNIKQKIMATGGIELQIQNSKVDSIEGQIELTQARQKKVRTQLKKLDIEMTRGYKEKEKLLQNRTYCDNELSTLSSNLVNIRDNIRKAESELAMLEEKRVYAERQQDNLKNMLSAIDGRINEFNAMEANIKTQLEKLA